MRFWADSLQRPVRLTLDRNPPRPIRSPTCSRGVYGRPLRPSPRPAPLAPLVAITGHRLVRGRLDRADAKIAVRPEFRWNRRSPPHEGAPLHAQMISHPRLLVPPHAPLPLTATPPAPPTGEGTGPGHPGASGPPRTSLAEGLRPRARTTKRRGPPVLFPLIMLAGNKGPACFRG